MSIPPTSLSPTLSRGVVGKLVQAAAVATQKPAMANLNLVVMVAFKIAPEN
jgi:hypothetical protein